MIHTFLMELTDDVKGYPEEVERLERIYGIEEFNLAEHDAKIKAELLADLEQRLRFWDKGANAIPDYVWHCINAMKGSEKNECL